MRETINYIGGGAAIGGACVALSGHRFFGEASAARIFTQEILETYKNQKASAKTAEAIAEIGERPIHKFLQQGDQFRRSGTIMMWSGLLLLGIGYLADKFHPSK